jgi:hypothetical protein
MPFVQVPIQLRLDHRHQLLRDIAFCDIKSADSWDVN